MTIDHRPALRHELERGEGDPEPRAVEIAVQLRNPVPCENSSWIVGRTESDDPGSFEENAAILEAMMRSLDLDRWR